MADQKKDSTKKGGKNQGSSGSKSGPDKSGRKGSRSGSSTEERENRGGERDQDKRRQSEEDME